MPRPIRRKCSFAPARVCCPPAGRVRRWRRSNRPAQSSCNRLSKNRNDLPERYRDRVDRSSGMRCLVLRSDGNLLFLRREIPHGPLLVHYIATHVVRLRDRILSVGAEISSRQAIQSASRIALTRQSCLHLASFFQDTPTRRGTIALPPITYSRSLKSSLNQRTTICRSLLGPPRRVCFD